jgi:hypothetical protein
MQENTRKFPLSIPEVILTMIFIPIIFYGAMRILIKPMNSPHMPNWFFGPIGLLIVIGFDVLWLIAMRLWVFKGIKVKIFLTLLVLTLSSSIITCWILLNSLSGIW